MQENRLASGDDETGRGCSEYYRPSRVEGVVNEGGRGEDEERAVIETEDECPR